MSASRHAAQHIQPQTPGNPPLVWALVQTVAPAPAPSPKPKAKPQHLKLHEPQDRRGRLHVDIPRELHVKLKTLAASKDTTVRALMLETVYELVAELGD